MKKQLLILAALCAGIALNATRFSITDENDQIKLKKDGNTIDTQPKQNSYSIEIENQNVRIVPSNRTASRYNTASINGFNLNNAYVYIDYLDKTDAPNGFTRMIGGNGHFDELEGKAIPWASDGHFYIDFD